MNPVFNTVFTASQAERRDLFLAAAARLGKADQSMLLMNIIPVSTWLANHRAIEPLCSGRSIAQPVDGQRSVVVDPDYWLAA